MNKSPILINIIFFTTTLFGQNTFSDCYDTLKWALSHDHYFDTGKNKALVNINNSIRVWQDCIRNKPIPDLFLQTISGDKIETEKLRGKVLVINLWFAGCHPCVAEMPALNRLVEEYKKREVVFLGISTDDKQTLKSEFLPHHQFDFTVIPDADSIVERIGHTGFPTTYIVDKSGRVRAAWIGGETGEHAKTAAYERAKPIIDELLKAE